MNRFNTLILLQNLFNSINNLISRMYFVNKYFFAGCQLEAIKVSKNKFFHNTNVFFINKKVIVND